MSGKGSILWVTAVLGLLLTAPTARAQTTGCDVLTASNLIQTLIADTSAATVGVDGFLSQKDKDGLVAKASNALTKLGEGKIQDALQKLEDYRSTLNAIHSALKPKISDTLYSQLSTDVNAAIACVSQIPGS